jgi:hypothetical protein
MVRFAGSSATVLDGLQETGKVDGGGAEEWRPSIRGDGRGLCSFDMVRVIASREFEKTSSELV